MACGLTAPSHYLNQCWLLINVVPGHSPESYFTRMPEKLFSTISVKITLLKFPSRLPRANGINSFRFVLFCRSLAPVEYIHSPQGYFNGTGAVVWMTHTASNSNDTELTHLPMDKMTVILADDIFNCIFLKENNRIPIEISLKYVPRSPIDKNQHWLR